jgi:hypothetical protein
MEGGFPHRKWSKKYRSHCPFDLGSAVKTFFDHFVILIRDRSFIVLILKKREIHFYQREYQKRNSGHILKPPENNFHFTL